MRIFGPFLTGLATFTLVATSASAEPSAKQLALAKRYFTAAQIDKQVDQSISLWIPTMDASLTKSHPELSPEQHQLILVDLTEVAEAYLAKTTARLLPIIAETFTESELADLVAFCESPAGQALMAKQPTLLTKITALMSSTVPEYTNELRARWCAKLSCTPTEASETP